MPWRISSDLFNRASSIAVPCCSEASPADTIAATSR